jgi:hypothetical protein
MKRSFTGEGWNYAANSIHSFILPVYCRWTAALVFRTWSPANGMECLIGCLGAKSFRLTRHPFLIYSTKLTREEVNEILPCFRLSPCGSLVE